MKSSLSALDPAPGPAPVPVPVSAPGTSKRRTAPDPRTLFPSTRPDLIQAILPAYEVHIVGGPSGAGKSRWLLQTLDAWRRSLSIYSFESHPVPWVYVSCDRSYASVCATCRDIGLDPATIPVLPARDLESDNGAFSVAWLWGLIKKYYPAAELIVIEGLGTLVPAGKTNDYNVVAKFLRELGRRCIREKKTVIGTHHTAKAKGDDGGYGNDREKLLGSAAWSAFVETIFMVDLAEPSNPKSLLRKLSVLTRTSVASFTVNYKFDGTGKLVELSPTESALVGLNKKKGKRASVRETMHAYFEELRTAKRDHFELADVLKYTGERGCSRSTVIRQLEEWCEENVLTRPKHGQYFMSAISVAKRFEGVLV